MEVNLVAEGVKFMVLGMSAVFLFLVLMVYVVKLQHIIITKFFPQTQTFLPQQAKNDNNKLDDNVVAAIISAIRHFKISQKG